MGSFILHLRATRCKILNDIAPTTQWALFVQQCSIFSQSPSTGVQFGASMWKLGRATVDGYYAYCSQNNDTSTQIEGVTKTGSEIKAQNDYCCSSLHVILVKPTERDKVWHAKTYNTDCLFFSLPRWKALVIVKDRLIHMGNYRFSYIPCLFYINHPTKKRQQNMPIFMPYEHWTVVTFQQP